MPDPTDGIFLTIMTFVEGYGGARAALESRGYQRGFALGLAAKLMGFQGKDIDDKLGLRFRTANASVSTYFAGTTGVEERAHNEGVQAAVTYFNALSDDETSALLNAVHLRKSALQNPTRDDVYNLGGALMPIVKDIFEAAERAREEAERQEARRIWAESGCVGRKC
jgi:hypothetical protein